MTKATLIVKKNGNIYNAELHVQDTREALPYPEDFPKKHHARHGHVVDVDVVQNKIVKIQDGNDVLFFKMGAGLSNSSQPKISPKTSPHTGKHEKSTPPPHTETSAHAPYNFVPLNETVVKAQERPTFDRYHDDKHTGWIDLKIETVTPLYIRGTLTKEEVECGKETKDISRFFAPGGKLRIPGSSLRGMARSLVEIVSFGKFGFFDNKRLYFRALADRSNLRKAYQQRMSSFDKKGGKTNYKMSAGVLRTCGFNRYEILPSPKFWQIPKEKAKAEVLKHGGDYHPFEFYKFAAEYLVVSGEMQNKKKDWLIQFPSPQAQAISIPEDDVKEYLNDTNRGDGVPNLIALSHKGDAPCFYSKWTDQQGRPRISFGHTAMFRLAYEKKIGDHILQERLNDKNDLDFAEAMFGSNDTRFAGRVFFEDALLDDGQGNVLMGEATPRILTSPKPTTFQHYLTQSSADIGQLNHYNSSNATIRGNKLYWHKPGVAEDDSLWKEDPALLQELKKAEKKDTQHTRINPVKPHTTFTGRIRFENLSNEELGALLFVLDLPEGCLHKLGMGKPLGLGSIRVTPKLRLSQRMPKQGQQTRYTDLFCEWEQEPPESEAINEKKEAFEQYVRERLGHKGALWQTARLQELQTMLDYKIGLQLQSKNVYMQLGEFKKRAVLPKPSEV